MWCNQVLQKITVTEYVFIPFGISSLILKHRHFNRSFIFWPEARKAAEKIVEKCQLVFESRFSQRIHHPCKLIFSKFKFHLASLEKRVNSCISEYSRYQRQTNFYKLILFFVSKGCNSFSVFLLPFELNIYKINHFKGIWSSSIEANCSIGATNAFSTWSQVINFLLNTSFESRVFSFLSQNTISIVFYHLGGQGAEFLNGRLAQTPHIVARGGSRIFLRGGGGFSNFFQVDQIGFPSSLKALKRRCFGQIFCAAVKFLKKQVKKAVFGHFLENFDKKIAFFWRALLKVSIYWRLRRL